MLVNKSICKLLFLYVPRPGFRKGTTRHFPEDTSKAFLSSLVFRDKNEEIREHFKVMTFSFIFTNILSRGHRCCRGPENRPETTKV